MSIILKGIDMPKDCTECPLEGAEVDDDGFDYWYCKITESMATTIERPSNCPLVEIPTPHGRIIDEKELLDKIKRGLYSEDINQVIYSVGAEDIANAPTILDEEGE